MKWIQTKLQDKLYVSGLVLLAISLTVFCLPLYLKAGPEDFQWFVCNYGITALYFFSVLFSGRLKQGRDGLPLVINLLVLFLISAYALNRNMVVFEDSVNWLSVSLVLGCINFLVFSFRDALPRWVLYVMYLILGYSFAIFVYLFFYLFPIYLMSAVLALALGFSLHAFVPLLFCIYTVVIVRKTGEEGRSYRAVFFAGLTLPVFFAIYFVISWGLMVKEINHAYGNGIAEDDNDLPAYVHVAARVPQGWLAEKALQSDLVYNTPSMNGISFFELPTRKFGEERKHDPLVMLAAFFTGTPRIAEDERISILECMYDSRHRAQQRLRTGKHLVTDDIHTGVKVWPNLHLAYTEKQITVSNRTPASSWPLQEEAIYTFHLPEGSVVSALSLWIHGREEKGVVTTKEKADSAYTQIVGVERHDPSVVHWQEGNTVSVRVFPVLAGESRVFKIGVTTPLTKTAGSLTYENIWIDGPDAASATETIKMSFGSQPKDPVSQASFERGGRETYTHTGTYLPDWKMSFKDEGVSEEAFSFDGTTYSLSPYRPQRSPLDVGSVYLDVNSAWTKADFDEVVEAVKAHPVYVYDQELVRITDGNKEELFGSLQRAQFSLFPLYVISDPATALLVSKSGGTSPNIHDLEGSRFLAHTKDFLQHDNKVSFFNLGSTLTPYLKSMKELRTFRYEHGTPEDLKTRLARHQFAATAENDEQVVLDNAGLCITATPKTTPSLAHDHLMRLFTYNHLMQKAGAKLFADSSYTTDLTAEAAKASIVSPVSSMVVLETQKDYDRFNIRQSKNSLENASLKSKGAVPEPHEWALIILCLAGLLWMKRSSLKQKTGNV